MAAFLGLAKNWMFGTHAACGKGRGRGPWVYTSPNTQPEIPSFPCKLLTHLCMPNTQPGDSPSPRAAGGRYYFLFFRSHTCPLAASPRKVVRATPRHASPTALRRNRILDPPFASKTALVFELSGSNITGPHRQASHLRKRGCHIARTENRASDFKHEGRFRSEMGVKNLFVATLIGGRRMALFRPRDERHLCSTSMNILNWPFATTCTVGCFSAFLRRLDAPFVARPQGWRSPTTALQLAGP